MAKIQGLHFDDRKVIEITLNDDEDNPKILTARIRDLSMDVGDELQKRISKPQPPRRPLRDRKGPIRENGRVVIQEDLNDPDYVTANAIYNRRQGIAIVMEALDDDTWEFEAQRPEEGADKSEWEDYYDSIYGELKAIRFPQKAFMALVLEINKSTGVTDEDVAKATESF